MTQAANLAALGTNAGTTGILPAAGGGTAGTAGVTGFKNRLINGAMVIDQRNAGASGTASQYTVDRWYYYGSQASKGTWQQNAGSVTPPAGFTNYLGFTSSSAYSVTSTDIFMFYQIIEGYNIADLGWGTANAKTVTMSFQVRSSLTGTFAGVLQGAGGAWSYPFTYTIPVANTWTSISVTIAGQTSGTWGSTNGTGIVVRLSLGCGSTYLGTANTWANTDYYGVTGQTNVVGTNGATFYITGVQLEVGTAATNFDVRSYGTELALCQRYLPAYQLSGGQNISIINAYQSGNWITAMPTPVPTRVAATGVVYTGTITNTKVYYNNGVTFATGIVFNGCTNNTVSFNISSGGTTVGVTGLWACESAASTLYFTGCEL